MPQVAKQVSEIFIWNITKDGKNAGILPLFNQNVLMQSIFSVMQMTFAVVKCVHIHLLFTSSPLNFALCS